MEIKEVYWEPHGNKLVIKCDCEHHFIWPARISLSECPFCGNKEWWFQHEPADPFPGYKTAKVNLK